MKINFIYFLSIFIIHNSYGICIKHLKINNNDNKINYLNNKLYNINNSNILIKKNTNKYIHKNKYKNSIYEVKYGDTLYYISLITKTNLVDLAKINNINKPYIINIGQKIKICSNINVSSLLKNKELSVFYTKKNIFYKLKNNNMYKNIINNLKKIIYIKYMHFFLPNPIIWNWPVKDGIIINRFLNNEIENKGIDISGYKGQEIFSAADGYVYYVSNNFPEYGNIIIIKHDFNYFTVYAHNDIILVKKNQKIFSKQKIATMGSSGSNFIKLHFEIRYYEKSIDPIKYLNKI